MDWAVFAAVLGSVAAMAAAAVPYVTTMGDQGWYRRWVEVLQNGTTEEQQLVARERIAHYVRELTVTDRSRPRRRAALGVAGILLVATIVMLPAGTALFASEFGAWGWVPIAMAVALYGFALHLVAWFPDRERARVRRELSDELEGLSAPVRRRWVLTRRRHAWP